MSAPFHAVVARVALAEWRAMARQRVARVAALLMLALTLAATLVSMEQMRAVQDERARFQGTADAQWAAQPDRHPHRVVHYGHYVFRTLSPLAFFDFGVDPFTGHTLFLEGHRQNSANFSDAGQSSVLLRFGQLTPAFVLQVLAPLLIVFFAFGSVAREREAGQLRMLVSLGVRGRALLAGKLAGHGAVALLLAAPALLALAAVALLERQASAQALWMLAAYALYLLAWVLAAVLVSALLARARDALLALVLCWLVTVVLLPRFMPDVAVLQVPRPTRIEMEMAVHAALEKMGDSHNPDDPHFGAFRKQVLARYGVARVEDLPVNYGALVIAEGERMTSALFSQTMQADDQRQAAQGALAWRAALFSPTIALRRVSTALAGTDRASHARFLLEGEAYRYALVQALNRLHATGIAFANDRDQRIGSAHWRRMPRFSMQPAPLRATLIADVLPGMAVMAAWCALLIAAACAAAARLERNGQ